MTGPTSFAIILTHNRPVELAATVAAISPQVDQVIIIDNASDPPVALTSYESQFVIRESRQPPNLSAMWNLGLMIARSRAVSEWWNVALLCDDVVVQPDWFETVRASMRHHGASAASTHQATPVSSPIIKHEPDRDVWNRMCGWAFVIAGERGLRADERLHWWYCDSHLDFLARRNGGMVIAPGPVAPNGLPNDWLTKRADVAARVGEDQRAFAEIWGYVPWP